MTVVVDKSTPEISNGNGHNKSVDCVHVDCTNNITSADSNPRNPCRFATYGALNDSKSDLKRT